MRLIDADVAQKIADEELFVDDAGTVQHILSHTPTIDAVPVVHGVWVNIGVDEFVCGVCGGHIEYQSRYCGYAYCPNCGAKMDK